MVLIIMGMPVFATSAVPQQHEEEQLMTAPINSTTYIDDTDFTIDLPRGVDGSRSEQYESRG
jgi:hypothetical protein